MLDIVRLAPSATAGEAPQLPRNIEAEAAFLGAILIDNRVVEDLPVQLTAAHFFEPLHGRVYEQILRLIDRNMLVTPVAAGWLMSALGAWRERRGQDRIRIDRFAYGYLFALGLGLVRFFFAG